MGCVESYLGVSSESDVKHPTLSIQDGTKKITTKNGMESNRVEHYKSSCCCPHQPFKSPQWTKIGSSDPCCMLYPGRNTPWIISPQRLVRPIHTECIHPGRNSPWPALKCGLVRFGRVCSLFCLVFVYMGHLSAELWSTRKEYTICEKHTHM